MPTSSSDAALLELDLYFLLDPSRSLTSASSSADVSRFYRKRARALHPDKNPDRADAADAFDQLQRAYELLSDEQRRAQYDERWKVKQERKRKRQAEDGELQRMRQRLQQREMEAQQRTTAASSAHQQPAALQQRRAIQRENEAAVAQLRAAAAQPQPSPPPPPSHPSASASSSTVVLSLAQPIDASALRSHFARYGGVEHAMVRQGGIKAFVTFYQPHSAEAARRGEQWETRRWTVGGLGEKVDAERRERQSDQRGEAEDERKEIRSATRPAAAIAVELKAYEASTLAKLRELAKRKREGDAGQTETGGGSSGGALSASSAPGDTGAPDPPPIPPAGSSTAPDTIEIDV